MDDRNTETNDLSVGIEVGEHILPFGHVAYVSVEPPSVFVKIDGKVDYVTLTDDDAEEFLVAYKSYLGISQPSVEDDDDVPF